MDRKPHCGLCGVETDNWEEHVKSEQHQTNLANPILVKGAELESQLPARLAIEKSMREDKET